MNIELQLRDTLHRAADEVGSADASDAVRTSGMRGLAHSRRRRQLAVLSAGLAVLLVAVVVPLGIALLRTPSGSVAAPQAPAPPSAVADIFGGPTRGDLAGDATFVEAVRQLSWTEGSPIESDTSVPNPAVELRRVTFAGDVTAGRWALVVGATDDGGLAAVWFAGPPGATAAQMEPVGLPGLISPDQPATLYDSPSGSLVVVAAPEDVIEVSARPEVAADATVSRTFTDLGTRDGLLVAAMDGNPWGSAAQYRVTRDGAILVEQALEWTSTAVLEQFQGEELELNYVRPPAEGTREQTYAIAGEILGEYGLTQDQLDLQVSYLGFVPGLVGLPGVLAVVTATFPSGAVLTRAQASLQDEEGISTFYAGVCTSTLSAAGSAAARGVVALRCDIQEPHGSGDDPASIEFRSELVVLAPAGAAGGYAVVTGLQAETTLDLDDAGFAVADFPEGAQSVVIHAADDSVVDEVPIFTA